MAFFYLLALPLCWSLIVPQNGLSKSLSETERSIKKHLLTFLPWAGAASKPVKWRPSAGSARSTTGYNPYYQIQSDFMVLHQLGATDSGRHIWEHELQLGCGTFSYVAQIILAAE